MTDYFDKKIDVLVTAYKDAAARSRSVFLTVNVTVAISLTVIINSTSFFVDHDLKEKSVMMGQNIDELRSVLAEQTAFIQIPIVGIKVFTTDLGLITCLAMCVLCTWFYFSMRRERMIVHEIYKDLTEAGSRIEFQLFDYVYQGLVNQTVFSTTTKKDFYNKRKEKYSSNIFGRFFVKIVLLYSPVITMLLVLTRDLFWLSQTTFPIHQSITVFVVKNLILPAFAIVYCISQIRYLINNEDDKNEKLSLILHQMEKLSANRPSVKIKIPQTNKPESNVN